MNTKTRARIYDRVCKLYLSGKTQAEVGQIMGYTTQSVSLILKRRRVSRPQIRRPRIPRPFGVELTFFRRTFRPRPMLPRGPASKFRSAIPSPARFPKVRRTVDPLPHMKPEPKMARLCPKCGARYTRSQFLHLTGGVELSPSTGAPIRKRCAICGYQFRLQGRTTNGVQQLARMERALEMESMIARGFCRYEIATALCVTVNVAVQHGAPGCKRAGHVLVDRHPEFVTETFTVARSLRLALARRGGLDL